MEKKNENRRVRMTKRLMKDALLELLEKKELANVSVTAICDQADVHRSTFYQYYSDQADLLREIEQDFLDMIPTPSQLQKDQDQILAVTTRFFDFIKQNEKTFRNCVYDHTAAPVTVHTVAKCRNCYEVTFVKR